MTATLRLFAALIRDGSWVRAVIDRPAASSIGPPHDLRRMLVPLGRVVAVFGASNFPLAYGVCGGDTASALAAGCAVVVKEHPAHPGIGRLLAHLARQAIASTGASPDLLGYVRCGDPHNFKPARDLILHPEVCAVGFTGSRAGGLALEKLARERPVPIPVFAEMGSTNAVLVSRAAAAERGPAIAAEIAASIVARFGQQCTCPGIVLVDAPPPAAEHPVLRDIARALAQARPRRMVAPWVLDNYTRRLAELGVPPHPGDMKPHMVLTDSIAHEPRWLDEVFGPGCVGSCVDFDDPPALETLVLGPERRSPMGMLVASAYVGSTPTPIERRVLDLLTQIAGRVAVNGVPTGVRVSPAVVHGGPLYATNHPNSTAVGPLAIERWCRPVCFQNWPDELLPAELRDSNPLGIRRVES